MGVVVTSTNTPWPVSYTHLYKYKCVPVNESISEVDNVTVLLSISTINYKIYSAFIFALHTVQIR